MDTMGTKFAACEYFLFFPFLLKQKKILNLIWHKIKIEIKRCKKCFTFADNLKLTCLHEYYQRLLHGTQPTPSGIDMANTVKYFAQTLLCKYNQNNCQTFFCKLKNFFNWKIKNLFCSIT